MQPLEQGDWRNSGNHIDVYIFLDPHENANAIFFFIWRNLTGWR
jgi:hypothetical protein